MDLTYQLRNRIDDFGLGTEDLARRARIERERVDDLLEGAVPTLDELQRLGRALVFDPYAVVRGEGLPEAGRSAARFKRPEGSLSPLSPRDVYLLERAGNLSQLGGWLHRLMDRPIPLLQLRSVVPIASDRNPWEQGYELGAEARKHLADLAPVPCDAPIDNVQQILESLGAHVADVTLESGLTAAAVQVPDGIPVILLNRRSPRVRSSLSRRSTLAHELCHLLHDGGERDLLTVTTRYSYDPVEKRANGFAPAFIAPPSAVGSELATLANARNAEDDFRRRVTELARKWGLSPEGIVWHAKNCGRLPASVAERLAHQAWPSVETTFESPLPRAELPDSLSVGDLVFGRYSDLVMEALGQDLVSEGRAMELLDR